MGNIPHTVLSAGMAALPNDLEALTSKELDTLFRAMLRAWKEHVIDLTSPSPYDSALVDAPTSGGEVLDFATVCQIALA